MELLILILTALAWIVGVVILAGVLLWAITKYAGEASVPARQVVGGVVILAIIVIIVMALTGRLPSL